MTEPIADYLEIESEDDLTRIVFGILELIGGGVVGSVLREAGISLQEEPSYSFFKKIDPAARRTPDVILETTAQTVMIEIKRERTIDEAQLAEQHRDLEQFGSGDTTLLFISGHDERPRELDTAPLDSVSWLGWRDVALTVLREDRSELSHTQERLLDVVVRKLQGEGYVPFTGIDESLLDEVAETWSVFREFFTEIHTFIRAVEGRVDERGLKAKNLWRDGISQDFHQFPSEWRFITDHLWVAFARPGEEVTSKGGAYLFIAFCWHEGDRPSIRVGYSLSPGFRPGDATMLVEHNEEIASFVESTEFRLLRTTHHFDIREAFVNSEEIHPALSDQESVEGFERMQVAIDYDSASLSDPTVTGSVADDLVAMDAFVEDQLMTSRGTD